MERFQPADTPIWKKILGSPVLYVGLTFAIVFASISFIRERQKEELRARVEYLRGGPVLVERQQRNSAQASSTDEPEAQTTPTEVSSLNQDIQTDSAASTAAPSETPPAGDTAPPAAASAETSALAMKKVDPSAPKPATNHRAIVIYAEVDQLTLNSWMEEMRASGQLRNFDEVSMGPLTQISQKLKSARGVKILQQIEHPLPAPHAPLEWFAGTHRTQDPENEMGFFSSLVMGDMKDGLVRGEIEVQRAFRDPNDATRSIERISYGGSFEMATGSGYIMRGLLPRKYATVLEEGTNSDPFLSIFKSPDFRNGQSEFTLILEFDTSVTQR